MRPARAATVAGLQGGKAIGLAEVILHEPRCRLAEEPALTAAGEIGQSNRSGSSAMAPAVAIVLVDLKARVVAEDRADRRCDLERSAGWPSGRMTRKSSMCVWPAKAAWIVERYSPDQLQEPARSVPAARTSTGGPPAFTLSAELKLLIPGGMCISSQTDSPAASGLLERLGQPVELVQGGRLGALPAGVVVVD